MTNPCFDCEKCIECREPCEEFKEWVRAGCPKDHYHSPHVDN